MDHGNLEHRLVAIILSLLGMSLQPWGVHWLAVVGLAILIAGLVVGFFGPLIWFLAELVASPLKRLFCFAARGGNKGSKKRESEMGKGKELSKDR